MEACSLAAYASTIVPEPHGRSLGITEVRPDPASTAQRKVAAAQRAFLPCDPDPLCDYANRGMRFADLASSIGDRSPQLQQTGADMDITTPPLTIAQLSAEYWRVTIDNPPINLFDPDLVAGLAELMDRLEADDHVKVVVFDSADPDYFISHLDLLRVGEEVAAGSTGLPAWPDITTRLERAQFVTVGSVRGRARGVGSELLLALDVRFASLERALFCQPEVGFGFVPGGGGLERLPLVTGRSRALEIIVGCEDFDAATAERYGWINRAIPDDELDAFVDRFAQRVASFDRHAIALAKRLLNERGQIATPHDLVATYEEFGDLLAEPTTQARAARFLSGGLQQRSDFEFNLSDHLQD